MNRVVLQIPMNPKLKKNAEKKAEEEGFSSLQEAVRVFLSKFADGRLEAGFREQFPPVQLSPKAIKRYNKMDEDIKSGKMKLKSFNSVDELMEDLMK